MASKWGFLKGKIAERDPNEEPGYAQRYAEVKAELVNLNFEELSQQLTSARETKDRIAKHLADAALEVTVLERLVIEKIESAGLESVVAGGYRLTPSTEPVFQKRDGQALREWAEQTGHEDLLTINSRTLESLAKEYYLAEETAGDVIPGLELTGTYTKLSRTKQR